MFKVNIDMPENCKLCPLYIEGNSEFLIYGERLGGKCKALPIKDYEGKTVEHQIVIGSGDDVNRTGRYHKCPLRRC